EARSPGQTHRPGGQGRGGGERRGAAGSGLTRRIRRLRSPARGSAVEGRSRSMTTPPTMLKVAIIGTGVIGAAWASGFLAAGHSITAFDPAPGAEARLREQVKRNLAVVDSEQAAAADRLRFAVGLAEAVSGADFVQENGPGRLEAKQSLLAELDAAAPRAAIIASSTSGYAPSEIAARAASAPERIIVGHPFNPAHLIPLVEVVPSPATRVEVAEEALEIYRSN